MPNKKRGRPSKAVNIDLAQVEALAGFGFTIPDMAAFFRISPSSVSAYAKRYPKFMEALKNGRARADAAVTKSLYQQAIGGNTTAMIFWLKNRRPDLWRDRHDFEHSGQVDSALTVRVVKTTESGNGKGNGNPPE